MPILVGTCGWSYRDWRGRFYPAGLPQRAWLDHYAEHFATVELDNAFYRLPAYETFRGWHDKLPEGFVVAVKASRFLTHVKRLRDPAEPVRRLLDHARGLGDRLGPVLLQLPPTLRADVGLLGDCLTEFPAGIRVAVEPRHESWWTTDVRRMLERQGAALAWTDRLGRPLTPLWRTADWGYVRFHEGRAQPWPRYGRAALRSWVERIASEYGDDADVHTYFNNDPGGAAVDDAVAFARIARTSGRTVSRTPDLL
ncbi:MAG TPA: DUF72 domain-containing protein [Actinopolymorphaceae bacterium]|nr:DUF72 domain-containing protein [Actinopolymorphaceae bacterium]